MIAIGMRRFVLILALSCVATPASASDLAAALNFAQGIMGDEIVEGYEDFVDYDPSESLHILLARDVQDTSTAYEPYYQDGVRRHDPRTKKPQPHFRDLGRERLSFDVLAPYIRRAAKETGLPVALIDAVIRTESGYRPRAVSRTGAKGLMQLMPATALSVGVFDAFDPAQNIMGGSRYLRKMYDRFGTVRLAVAAYNAGPGRVRKYKGMPPLRETQRYVKAVMSRYKGSSNRR